MYTQYKKHVLWAFAWLVIASIPVQAQLLSPEQYLEGTCELAAKEYRTVYGGDLIFVQPLNADGSFDLGEYKGTWMNKAWNKVQGTYYVNYPQKMYYNSSESIVHDYKANKNIDVIVYNINEVHPPFNLVYHY